MQLARERLRLKPLRQAQPAIPAQEIWIKGFGSGFFVHTPAAYVGTVFLLPGCHASTKKTSATQRCPLARPGRDSRFCGLRPVCWLVLSPTPP